MKNSPKKLISIILSLCMVLSILAIPTAASAYIDNPNPDIDPLDDPSTPTYGYSVLSDGTAKLLYDNYKYGIKHVPTTVDGYTISMIGENAYSYVTDLFTLYITNNVREIGKAAFYGCANIEKVIIPENVTKIAGNAFDGCTKVKLYVPKNSYAESFAIQHNIDYVVQDINDCEITIEYGTDNGDYLRTYVKKDGKWLTQDDDFVVTVTHNEKEKTGVVTVKGADLYSGTYQEVFSYTPNPRGKLACSRIELSQYSFVYDGTEKRPTVKVIDQREDWVAPDIPGVEYTIPENTYGDVELKEGVDYTVSFKNNVEIGTATVEITGIGDYDPGVIEAYFTITGQEIKESDVHLDESEIVYSGEDSAPDFTVTHNGQTLTEGVDYTTSYSYNSTAGTVTITVKGKGSYAGTVTKTVKVNPADISKATVRVKDSELKYDGKAKTPEVTVTYNSKLLKQGEDYTLEYKNNVNAGTGSVVVTGTGNFKGSKTAYFTIANTTHSISECSITLSKTSYTYNGSECKPTVTVKYNSTTLKKDTDYTVSYSSNTNAGTAFVTVTGKGTYTGSTSKSFTINKVSLSNAAITLSQNSYIFDTNEKTPTATVTLNSKTLKKNTDYTVTYLNNTNAGDALVSVSGKGNYSGTATKYFTIVPTSIINVTASLSNYEYDYDGTAKTPEVYLYYKQYTLKKGVDYTVEYQNNVNAGNATAYVSGIGNFKNDFGLSFMIKGQYVTSATVTLSNNNYTYDGNEKTPSVNVTLGTKTLTKNTDYTVTYSNNTNAGTASVRIDGKGIYSGYKTTQFTINPRKLSNASVTLDQTSYNYDGTAKRPKVTVTYGSTTLRENTDYTVSYSNNTNIGTAKATVEGKGNYTGSNSATYSINSVNQGTFTWGKDNWNFNNNSNYFSSYAVNSSIMQKAHNYLGLSNVDRISIEDTIEKKTAKKWNGSCYGMTTTQMLVKQNMLNLTDFGGKSIVYNNTNDTNMVSLINYFQDTQNRYSAVTQSLRRKEYVNQYNYNQYDVISTLENYLKNNNKMVNIFFEIDCIYNVDYVDNDGNVHKKGSYGVDGYHSILGYGVSNANYTDPTTKKTYDKRILIADPCSLRNTKLDEKACIYYRSSDHSWVIPFWCKEYSKLSDIAYWNSEGVYKDGQKVDTGDIYNIVTFDGPQKTTSLMFDNSDDHYIAGIEVNNAEKLEANVTKLSEPCNDHMTYLNDDGEEENIKKYHLSDEFESSTNDDPTEYFALWNPTAGYNLSYDKQTDYDLRMDYEDIAYFSDLKNSSQSIVRPNGIFYSSGENLTYDVSMVTNDSLCVTDWYNLNVKGSGTDSVLLKKASNGYILTSDNLKDITLNATGKDAAASATFSTDYPSVYIYEINEHTIGVKVDSDGDKTYDEDITVNNTATAPVETTAPETEETTEAVETQETTIEPTEPDTQPDTSSQPATEASEPVTEAPTNTTTQPLTDKPTEAPTQAPTQAPTEKPTQAPTQQPTQAPTEIIEPTNPKPAVTPEISPNTISLSAGKSKTIIVKNGKVNSWKSSNSKVAKVKDGKVTALKKGSADITAVLTNGKQLVCKVKVKNNPTIKIGNKKYKKNKTYTVKKGKSLAIKINGKAPDVKNTYKSSKKKIAKIVSKKTAKKLKLKAYKKGKTIITVNVNGVKFRFKIKVK